MRKKGRMFFFEKKNQKTFISWWCQRNVAGHGLDLRSGGGTKVFWFFFSKKNTFSCAA
jgi:hypothetical protein